MLLSELKLFARGIGKIEALWVLAAGGGLATAGQVNLVRTNYVDRWFTNQIEVRMPFNHFVTEYRTNWVEQFRTNLADVYLTNIVQRTMTNHLWVERTRTNWLEASHTNWQTLNLTNWTTVFAFKTNWIIQPLTNVVNVDLPAAAPARRSEVQSRATQGEVSGPLLLEAAYPGKPASGGKVEVRLSVRWSKGNAAPLLVRQWRVEKDDGSVLCFGQDQDFKRALPVGQYRVQVSAHRTETSPLLAALGTLAVTSREVSLQQGAGAKVTN